MGQRTDLAKEIVHKNADISAQFRVNVDEQLRHVLQTFAHTLVTEVIRKVVCPLSKQAQHQ